jgi:hypothetical protein
MRQKPWNSVKIGGPRKTRGQHLPWQEHTTDQVQVSKTVLSRPPVRPSSLSWPEWDGSSWNTTALAIHRISAWYQAITQTSQSFSRQMRMSQDVPTKTFWRDYYRATAYAINSMKSLHLFIIENKTIVSVLRSAPARISNRMTIPRESLKHSQRELQEDYNDLYLIRRIKVHRFRNAEYFKVETQQHRTMGKAWVRSSNFLPFLRASRIITADHTGRLDVTFDAYPPRWTIEPLKFAVRMTIVQLNLIMATTKASLVVLKPGLSPELRDTINAILATFAVLHELLEQMAALRYYRLHQLPHRSLEKEIELGRRLWQQLRQDVSHETTFSLLKQMSKIKAHRITTTLHEKSSRVEENEQTKEWLTRSKSNAGKTISSLDHKHIQSTTNIQRAVTDTRSFRRNTSGFMSWKVWDGRDWNVHEFLSYLDSPSVRVAAAAREEYTTLSLRFSCTAPRDFDSFLMAHYKSQWMANQSMHAFIRVQVSISVMEYILRTAPPRISQALAAPITQINIHSYELAHELETLRKIRTSLACLPENPFFFRSSVKDYRANQEAALLSMSMRLDMKADRLRYKADHGFKWNSREYNLNREGFVDEMQQVASLRANSRAWQEEHPFSVVLPFRNVVNFTAVRHIRVVNAVRRIAGIFLFVFPYSGLKWARIVGGINRTVQSAIQVILLNRDLTAIRYYRMHHFPNSTSERILELDQAGYQRMMQVREVRELVQRKRKLKTKQKAKLKARECKRKERREQGIPEPPPPTSRMFRKKRTKANKCKLREEALAAQPSVDVDITHVKQMTGRAARQRRSREKVLHLSRPEK